jgi:hypothetical protein
MTDTTHSAPRFYSLDARLPASVFGETYIITAYTLAPRAPQFAIAEYYVLTTRADPALLMGKLSTHFGEIVPELGSFSEDDVHAEARDQALADLSDLLEKRAGELGRPDIAFVQLQARPIEARPLLGAWMRNKWHREITWLAAGADNKKLARYCQLIVEHVKPQQPFVVVNEAEFD